jgi:hypothetical protein
MSNSLNSLTKLRANTYRLSLWAANLVLVDTGDATDVYVLDADNNPALLTSADRDFLTVAREVLDGRVSAVEDYLQELEDEYELRIQAADIAAEMLNELSFEERGYDTDGIER